MAKLNRPNGKLFGSSATNIGVFGSGQTGETPTTSTNPDAINTLGTHWEDGWNGAVVSQAPYTAPFVEDMNAVNYVNSYNGAYLLQQGIPEYSRTADYYVDSICTYNGAIYICILDNPAVNASTDPNDPPGTLINFDPTDTTHWDERVELPTMNDNEVLVGSVGGTGVATDTLNQGDIVASSSGLNIKAQAITNADVNDSAAIAEAKLDLDYSTDSLNTAITNKSISNLKDTNITNPIGAGDVIAYDDINSEWVNSNALANHLTDTNNPHDTSVANLDDTNVNDRQTLADGDVMVYDLANTDWVNSPSLKNHLSDTNNPHTTTLANLDDTTITTPQDGETILYDANSTKWVNSTVPGGALSSLSDTTITAPITDKSLVQYDQGAGKWVNSTDVWSTIEVNDIAYVGTTPNGHSLVGGVVTMQATDNRHQVLTTTGDSSGNYQIVLPSTGIKAGETFSFDFNNLDATASGEYAIIRTADSSVLRYYYHKSFTYQFTALVDNPTNSAGWLWGYKRRYNTVLANSIEQSGISLTAGTRYTKDSGTMFSLCPGTWFMSLSWSICRGNSPSSVDNPWYVALVFNDNGGTAKGFNSDRLAGAFGANIPMGSTQNATIGGQTVYFAQMPAFNTAKLIQVPKNYSTFMRMSAVSSANATNVYMCARASGTLWVPKSDAMMNN